MIALEHCVRSLSTLILWSSELLGTAAATVADLCLSAVCAAEEANRRSMIYILRAVRLLKVRSGLCSVEVFQQELLERDHAPSLALERYLLLCGE